MSAATTTPHTPWPTVKLGDVCEASTGEALYAQIQAKKAELIKAGKLKKEKPLPPISPKEIPFEIPSTWKWVRLGEICTITTGKKDANFGNVNGKYLFFTCAKDPIRSNSYSFSGESILLAGNGDIGNISYYVGKFEAYQRTYVLQPYFEFSYLIYIFYHLRGYWVNYNAEKMFGSAMPYIRLGNIQNYPIPLPPLDVQREIVAKVEAGLKEADGLVAHFKRLAALADDTFKAELESAIQGKLVEQRLEEGSADTLYAQIEAEKQTLIKVGKLKKGMSLSKISIKEIPFDIPTTWKWVRWGDVSHTIQYGYNTSAQSSGRIRIVRITDIQDGKINWNTVPYCNIEEDEINGYLLQKKMTFSLLELVGR